MILDLQQFFKTKKDKQFKQLTDELPKDVDTEGTPDSRKKAQNMMLKAAPSLYSFLSKMRADKQINDAKNGLKNKAKSRTRLLTGAEATSVKIGLGTKGHTGAF